MTICLLEPCADCGHPTTNRCRECGKPSCHGCADTAVHDCT